VSEGHGYPLVDRINPGNIKFELRDHDSILGWDVFPWLKATYKNTVCFAMVPE
jgi:hypothetical protein